MTDGLLNYWRSSAGEPLHALFGQAPVMMYETNGQATLRKVSHFWADALGYAAEEMIGRKTTDFMTSESRRRAEEVVIPEFIERGRIHNVPFDFLHKDGRVMPTAVSTIARFREDGVLEGALSVLLDSSEVVDARDMLQGALNAITEGFVVYDDEERLVAWNDAYRTIYERSAPAIRKGASFESIVRYGLENGQFPEAGTTEASKRAWLEWRMEEYRDPGGLYRQQIGDGRWIAISEHRTPRGFSVGVRTDITELIEARSEAERLGRILERCSHEIYIIDVDTLRFELVNEGARSNLQYSTEELRNITVVDICGLVETPQDFLDLVAPLLDGTEQSLQFETRHIRKDGTMYPSAVRMELEDAGGQAVLVALCQDITERIALQTELERHREELEVSNRELEQKAKEAERANRSKSDFLANMSHEIRTPLNGVLGMAAALAQTPLTEKQLAMTETITSSGGQLLALLNDILDLSKVESEGISNRTSTVMADDLLAECADLFDAPARQKGLRLIIETEPSSRQPIIADATRIRQVVTNLLSNAVRFTDEGTITLRADLMPGDAPGRSKFEVRVIDTGRGVPDSMKRLIFERFQQGDHTAAMETGGTGLGLAIAKTICDLHGGGITVEDTPGGGATFVATFEVTLTEALDAETPGNPPARTLDAFQAPLRLLVAEDNEVNRLVLSAFFDLCPSVDAIFAVNGQEALDRLCVEEFDGALIDIRMPVMNGLDAVTALRRWEAEAGRMPLPVVACSANAMREQIDLYLNSGFDRYLPKPLKMDELSECLFWMSEKHTWQGAEPVSSVA